MENQILPQIEHNIIIGEKKPRLFTKIEKLRCEDEVLEFVRQGVPQHKIADSLNEKYKPKQLVLQQDVAYFLKKFQATVLGLIDEDEELAKIRAKVVLSWPTQLSEGVENMKQLEREVMENPELSQRGKVEMLTRLQETIRKHIYLAAKLSGQFAEAGTGIVNITNITGENTKIQQILAKAPQKTATIITIDNENKKTDSPRLSPSLQ